MIIIAWSPSGSMVAFFDEDVFKSVLSIFVTSAFLNLLQGSDDFLNNFLVQKINNFNFIVCSSSEMKILLALLSLLTVAVIVDINQMK